MNSSKEVIDLIMKLAKEKKMSLTKLAESVGVAKSTLSRYKNGEREFPINDIGKYADVLGVSVEYLLGLDESDDVEFDYFDANVSAGLPESIDGTNAKTIKIPKRLAGKWANDKDVKIVRINGESMNRVIPNGSLIGFKPVSISELRDGDIVLFNDDYEYSVKRFYNNFAERKLIFRPDSTDTLSFTDHVVKYENAGSLKIEGKVVMYLVELD